LTLQENSAVPRLTPARHLMLMRLQDAIKTAPVQKKKHLKKSAKLEDDEEGPHGAHSVAEAHQAPPSSAESSSAEDPHFREISQEEAEKVLSHPEQYPAAYFPVYFRNVEGAAIAIANSYSTGKGGTATSHAVAYGAPAEKKKE
jgi:hypothetical protein